MSQPVSIYTTKTADACAVAKEGVAVSGTSTFYSSPISSSKGDGFGIHMQAVGTQTGTWTAWRSDKPSPSLADDSDWVQDTSFGSAGSVAVSGNTKFADSSMNAKNRWWRLKYVNATNSGTIYAYATLSRSF